MEIGGGRNITVEAPQLQFNWYQALSKSFWLQIFAALKHQVVWNFEKMIIIERKIVNNDNTDFANLTKTGQTSCDF